MKVGGRRGEGGGSAQWGRARGTAAAAVAGGLQCHVLRYLPIPQHAQQWQGYIGRRGWSQRQGKLMRLCGRVTSHASVAGNYHLNRGLDPMKLWCAQGTQRLHFLENMLKNLLDVWLWSPTGVMQPEQHSKAARDELL